jgi:hypothetical protein
MNDQPTLEYDVQYPEHLSRLLIFIKWLLAIPHYIVLSVLGFVAGIVTIIAWFAILITGKYPRGMWDFVVKVLRWSANVNAYLYFMRDEYPPFGEGSYPVYFQLDYPERLSRGLIFIKWLLVIPHYIVLYFLNIAVYVVWIISFFAILITGGYPQGLFSFMVGYQRWNFRVTSYLLLLTDAYPPFGFGESPSVPPQQQGYQPGPAF